MKVTCISGTLCLHYSTYYVEFNVALLAIFLTVNEDLEHDISPLCRQHLVQFSAYKGKFEYCLQNETTSPPSPNNGQSRAY